MIININSISSTNKYNFGYNLTGFKNYIKYPISEINSLKVSGYLIKTKDHDIECSLHLKGTILVRDSRDDVPFEYPINITEQFLLFNEDDGEKEGYILDSDCINLDELAIKIIISSLPFKLYREGKSNTYNQEGIRSLTEEELSNKEPYNHSFDALKDLDL